VSFFFQPLLTSGKRRNHYNHRAYTPTFPDGFVTQNNVASDLDASGPPVYQPDTGNYDFCDFDAAASLNEYGTCGHVGIDDSASITQSHAYGFDTTALLDGYGTDGLVEIDNLASITQSRLFGSHNHNNFPQFGANNYVNPQDLAIQGVRFLVLNQNTNVIGFSSTQEPDPRINFIGPQSTQVVTSPLASMASMNPIGSWSAQVVPPPLVPVVNTNVVAVQQRIPCAHPPCLSIFTRDSDRRRHEATAHSIQSRTYFCPIVGCPKTSGTGYFSGYRRSDKVSGHLWKKHADLGYVKRT
jgi:hypothetical protein